MSRPETPGLEQNAAGRQGAPSGAHVPRCKAREQTGTTQTFKKHQCR